MTAMVLMKLCLTRFAKIGLVSEKRRSESEGKVGSLDWPCLAANGLDRVRGRGQMRAADCAFSLVSLNSTKCDQHGASEQKWHAPTRRDSL